MSHHDDPDRTTAIGSDHASTAPIPTSDETRATPTIPGLVTPTEALPTPEPPATSAYPTQPAPPPAQPYPAEPVSAPTPTPTSHAVPTRPRGPSVPTVVLGLLLLFVAGLTVAVRLTDATASPALLVIAAAAGLGTITVLAALLAMLGARHRRAS